MEKGWRGWRGCSARHRDVAKARDDGCLIVGEGGAARVSAEVDGSVMGEGVRKLMQQRRGATDEP